VLYDDQKEGSLEYSNIIKRNDNVIPPVPANATLSSEAISGM